MKTRFVPDSAWLVAIGAGVVLLIGAFARFDPASSALPTAAAPANPPAILQDAPPAQSALQPPLPANVSPGLSEIIKLAQAHVDESVMLAYVKSSGRVFSPSADEILYLSDLGLSQDIIGAIVKAAGSISPPPPQPPMADSAPDLAAPIAQAEPPPSAVQPEADSAAGMFLSSLAPYGVWTQQPDYGPVWQPTVETINPNWTPYVDAGQWMYSDSGWYWQSDYSWGWAAFHYGRWVNLPRQGWVWTPGNIWAPAWVAWRTSSSYVGWAPLPPGVSLNVLAQLTYNSQPVGPNPTFGLPATAYSFIKISELASRNLPRRVLPAGRVGALVKSSVALDSYAIVNNRIFNGGVSPDAVAVARQRPVRQVSLRAVSSLDSAGVSMDRKTLAVYVPPTTAANTTPAGTSKEDKNRVSPTAEKSSSETPVMLAENDGAETTPIPASVGGGGALIQLPPLRYAPAGRGSTDLPQANRAWSQGAGVTMVERPSTPAPRIEEFNPPLRPPAPTHHEEEIRPAPVEPPHGPPPAPPANSSSSSNSKPNK